MMNISRLCVWIIVLINIALCGWEVIVYIAGSTNDHYPAKLLGVLGTIDAFLALLSTVRISIYGSTHYFNQDSERHWIGLKADQRSFRHLLFGSSLLCFGVHGAFGLLSGYIEFETNRRLLCGLIAWCIMLLPLTAWQLLGYLLQCRQMSRELYDTIERLLMLSILILGSTHSTFFCGFMMAYISIETGIYLYDWYGIQVVQDVKWSYLKGDSLKVSGLIPNQWCFNETECKQQHFLCFDMNVPQMMRFQWHPMHVFELSIDEKTGMLRVSFILRAAGDWSDLLFSEYEAWLDEKIKFPDEEIPFYQVRLSNCYPRWNVPYPISSYPCALFITGGHGISSAQTLFNEWFTKNCDNEKSYGRFCWTVRENNFLLDQIQADNETSQYTLKDLKQLHFTPNNLIVQNIDSSTVKADLKIKYYLTRLDQLKSRKFRNQLKQTEQATSQLSADLSNIFTQSSLDIEYEVEELMNHAISLGYDRVVIVTCAPFEIQQAMRSIVSRYANSYIQIDLQNESYD